MITGVHLITGLIGSGKTLRAVHLIRQEVNAGRAVYACNINGLNIPGVIPFDDPSQWQDLPAGSLLVVDEAQRYWRARRSGEVPPELQAMETSRHDAVSFLIMTQQPTYLDKHLRGLVTRHEHLYRRMGASAAQLFRWERCIDDPMSASDRDGADQEMFVYPKQEYGSYTSSEQHTVKFRMGMKMKLVIAALCVAAVLIGWVVYDVANGKPKTAAHASEPSGLPDASALAPRVPAAVIHTGDQYALSLQPLVDGVPWTAPAFINRPIVSDPHVYCMSTANTCRCVTEQGTRFTMRDDRCRDVARWGEPYNPHKRPAVEHAEREEQPAQEKPKEVAATPAAPTLTGSTIAGSMSEVVGAL